MKLIERVLSQMCNVSGYQRRFLLILFSTIFCLRGKMNYRNLSRYSDLSEKTYSRQFRKPFDFVEFNRLSLQESMKGQHTFIAAIDCTYSPKSGNKTYGVDYFFSGQAGRSKKGLEVSLLSVVDVDQNTAYSLSAQQTPAGNQGENQEETRMDVYLQQIQTHRQALPSQVRYLVGDGYYAKKKFVEGVVAEDLHFIGKLRTDADLRFLYQGPQHPGPGAKKRYDGKFDLSQLSRFRFHGQLEDQVFVYSQLMNHKSLKRNLLVVCLLDWRDSNHHRHCFLFSTHSTQDPWEVIRFYKARFQIEFIFRDAKQFTGFSDCQAREKEALQFHFNASLTALNLLRMEHHRHQNASPVISIASYKARYFNEHFIHRIFSNLGFDLSLIKSHPRYEELRNYGAIAA